MDADKSVLATFSPMVSLSIYVDPLQGGSVTGGDGEISCSSDPNSVCNYSVLQGEQVTIEATPTDPNTTFSHWKIGTEQSTANPLTLTMDAAKVVEPVFVPEATDFIFPVLAAGQTDPLQNKTNPIGDGWHGIGVGDQGINDADGHLGQDYVINSDNGDGVTAGKPVYAVANGIIVEVMNNQNTSYGWCDNDDHGWGPVVVIRHENRNGFDTTGSIVTTSCDTETNPTVIYSLYGHLSKTSIQNLQIGQIVHMGDQLGVAGAYGVDQNSWTTNHPHVEIKDEGGYTEGTWYKTPANEGVCPESTDYTCDSYLIKGIGTAYSKENGFAPHRYELGAFINLNKQ